MVLVLGPGVVGCAAHEAFVNGRVDEGHGVNGIGPERDAGAYFGKGWGGFVDCYGDPLVED